MGCPRDRKLQGQSTKVMGEEIDADDVEARAPTIDEMEEIQKKLKGRDINELYEEQERRRTESD